MTGTSRTTPGHLAASYASLSTMTALIEGGFDISLRDGSGFTVLDAAILSTRGEEMMKYLLGAGGAGIINSQNNSGDTVLHNAARWDGLLCSEYTKLLVDNGGDADIENNCGETPASILPCSIGDMCNGCRSCRSARRNIQIRRIGDAYIMERRP